MRISVCIAVFCFHISSFAFTVIVDPGHGGHDRGAVKAKTVESSITLSVAKRLQKLIDDSPEMNVVMTRDTDRALTLKQRAQIAIRNSGELFLSIHANSSPDPRAKGAEFFIQNQLPPDSESMFLARREQHHHGLNVDEERMTFGPSHPNPYVKSVLEDLVRNQSIRKSAELSESLVESWLGFKKSNKYVIQQAPFYVVSNVPMPSVLVELGFITHRKERQLLKSSTYQNKLAQGIFKGLIKYKESVDKSH